MKSWKKRREAVFEEVIVENLFRDDERRIQKFKKLRKFLSRKKKVGNHTYAHHGKTADRQRQNQLEQLKSGYRRYITFNRAII